MEMPSAKKNFLTKHMNIFVDGDDTEVYIPMDDLRKCRLEEEYDWYGKDVYVGVDLAQTSDNTAISMVAYDSYLRKFVVKSWAFIPADRVHIKSKEEKIDYDIYIEKGHCFACGDNVVDYGLIEQFVADLGQKYKVNILDIGYDRYNCVSSANKWYSMGLNVTEIRQHSSVLHAPTKFFKEKVLQEEVLYERNPLLEINFANARLVQDTNLNGYLNKKKSTGKIDMCASLINAMVFWEKEFADGRSVYDDYSEQRKDTFIIL